MLGADVFYANLAMPETELEAAIAERLEDPAKRADVGVS
jgi:hypothetical protein